MRGVSYYLYLFVDLFSREIVGWQVYNKESANRARQLLTDICARADRAASANAALRQWSALEERGDAGSRSRPAVSNDYPSSKALFRTLKTGCGCSSNR